MKKSFLSLALLFVFCLLKATSIPDSLLQKLNATKGNEKLEVWVDWFNDFKLRDSTVFENARQIACQDAYSILEPDSAMQWCFYRKLKLARKFKVALDFKKTLFYLKDLKPLADSMAQLNSGAHLFLAEWHKEHGAYHYSKNNVDLAISEFKKSLKLFHAIGNYENDFYLYRYIAMTYAWNGFPESAFEFYSKADSVAENNDKISATTKAYTKFLIGSLNTRLGKLELAQDYYQEVLPFVDSLSVSAARRFYVNYYDNLCRLGDENKALDGFKRLKDEIELGQDESNFIIFYERYTDCLIGAGMFEEAQEANKGYIQAYRNLLEKKRDDELLKWQAKYETKEREGDITALVLEKEYDQSQFNLKLALISIVALFSLGVLAFFLYRNKVHQRQSKMRQERDQQIAENRDRLFSSITHDIRTPLALMLAPLERADEKSTEKFVKQDIQMARRHGKRLLELFNQILDWNKAEAKALSINRQVGQLDLTLESMCQRYEHQAFESGVDFYKRIDVPSPQYLLDFDKLDKIVSNLVGNAIKFTDKGKSVVFSANIRKQDEKELLFLQVKDEGPGIEEEEQENLFNRYFQGKAGKEKGGSGIGLALVKELVDLFQGTIELKSTKGEGATFNVLIPVEKAKVPVFDEALESKNATPSTTEEQPLVLLVEDEPDLLKFLHSSLIENYDLEVANTTSVGLNIAISRIPDLIICDWMLPDNNGGWFSREIKKNPLTQHIPILILTAQNDDDTRHEAYESGAIALMGKPFSLSTLKQQLKSILDQQDNVQKNWQNTNNTEPVSDEDSPSVDPFVQKAIELIQDNLGDEYYSVEKMAEQMALSRVQLFRKIRNLTGKSPSNLLKEYRMEKAKILLKEPGKMIAEIAYEVGFSDPSYFSKVYKKYFNTSPTQDQAG